MIYEFAAQTENETLRNLFYWNESAAKTESDIVFKKTCRIRNHLRLRQKMMFFQNKLVELD